MYILLFKLQNYNFAELVDLNNLLYLCFLQNSITFVMLFYILFEETIQKVKKLGCWEKIRSKP